MYRSTSAGARFGPDELRVRRQLVQLGVALDGVVGGELGEVQAPVGLHDDLAVAGAVGAGPGGGDQVADGLDDGVAALGEGGDLLVDGGLLGGERGEPLGEGGLGVGHSGQSFVPWVAMLADVVTG